MKLKVIKTHIQDDLQLGELIDYAIDDGDKYMFVRGIWIWHINKKRFEEIE